MLLTRSVTYFNEETETAEKWEYVFLRATNTPFPENEIDRLLWNIVDMERKEEKSRRVKSEYYYADLTKSDPTFLGYLYGTPFNVELDMGSDRKDRLGIFLLKGVYPSYSKN